MKPLGGLLLAAGFLAGAYVAVATVESVNWGAYGGCAAVMVVGMVLLRRSRALEMEQAGDRHTADVEVLRSSLASLIEKVRAIESVEDDREQLGVHHRIDGELVEDINRFVDARESLIPKLGMNRYAEVMSPFANGERLINRAWSASADGYVDEVRLCIRSAREEWTKANALLNEA